MYSGKKNLLGEIGRVIHHHFPELVKMVEETVQDPRRKKSTSYHISEIILASVYMYMMRCGSRNSINIEGEFQTYKNNYKKLFGLSLPHMDTVDDVLEKLEVIYLEDLKVKLIKRLLQQRVMHKFRYNSQYFIVAIDGTGIYKFDKSPYSGCPYKTSKNGKITYHQPVVEAKLVCSNGFSLSLATEFIINTDGNTKQDCEYSATIRILAKLKKHFQRLPMMVVLDGLYAKAPIMQTIKTNGWEFGIVWKDKTLYDLQDEIGQQIKEEQLLKFERTQFITKANRIESTYTFSNKSMVYKSNILYYAGVTETSIHLNCDKTTKTTITKTDTTTYKYLISTEPDKESIVSLVQTNRMRWKIENEGFNVQKNNGFELHHKMNRHSLTAINNYYQCLQIADIFNQLIILCKNTTVEAYRTTIKMWEYFCSELRLLKYEPQITENQKINLRY